MGNRIKIVCGLAVVSTLSACLTVGEDFPADVKWIEANKTQRTDVEKRFGPPHRAGYDTGMMTWTYMFYRYSLFRPTRTKDLVVRFNSNGSVYSYSFSSSFADEKEQIMTGK